MVVAHVRIERDSQRASTIGSVCTTPALSVWTGTPGSPHESWRAIGYVAARRQYHAVRSLTFCSHRRQPNTYLHGRAILVRPTPGPDLLGGKNRPEYHEWEVPAVTQASIAGANSAAFTVGTAGSFTVTATEPHLRSPVGICLGSHFEPRSRSRRHSAMRARQAAIRSRSPRRMV